MHIVLRGFLGMIPKIDDRALPHDNSVYAVNCKLDQPGVLQSLRSPLTVGTQSGGVLQSIYWYANKSKMLGFANDTDVVLNPSAGDAWGRLYFADGISVPKITDDSIIGAASSLPSSVSVSYDLGIEAPTQAPTAVADALAIGFVLTITKTDPVVITLAATQDPNAPAINVGQATGTRIQITNAAGVPELDGIWTVTTVSATEVSLDGSLGTTWSAGAYTPVSAIAHFYWDAVEAETRTYVYTYMSQYGEESAPSLPSAPITVGPIQTVTISNMMIPASITSSLAITNGRKMLLYRSAGADYEHVADIPFVDNSTYNDTTLSAQPLGEVMASLDYDVPPADLHSLVVHPNGFLCGLSGSDLCFSEPGMPHAWPVKYRQKLDFKGVGLGVFGSSVACLTTGHPEVSTGTHPANMNKEKIEIQQACVSKRGIVDAGYFIIYPSPDGLVPIGIGQSGIATSQIHTKYEFETVTPSSIRAYYYDDRYYGFSVGANGISGFVIDMKHPEVGMFWLDHDADAGYYDPEGDDLYLVKTTGGIQTLSKFEKDPTLMQKQWWSKHYLFPRHFNMAVAVVHALSYTDIVFELWAVIKGATSDDWTLVHTQNVTDDQPFRLPSGYLSQEYQIRLSGSDRFIYTAAAESMTELKGL